MTQVVRQQGRIIHWRDRAIQRSEGISDAWEVVKAYAARIAEWVLFGCMVANIIEMLPGVNVWPWFSTGVMGVQAVALDIAGFGLKSMGAAARRQGSNEAAAVAENTGKCLIGIVIATLVVVTIGVLFPATQEAVGFIEKALILVRVVMTVIYGQVIHSLREAGYTHQIQQDTLREDLQQARADLQSEKQKVSDLERRLQAEVLSVRNEQAHTINGLQQQLSSLQSDLESKTAELSSMQESLRTTQHNESILEASMKEKELSLQANLQAQVKAARDEMQAQMKVQALEEQRKLQADIDELKRANATLKAQAKEQAKAPAKPTKQVSKQTPVEEFNTRQFVYACLRKDPTMKLSEIVQAAKMEGQELSEPTISRYRKEYRESSSVVQNESSAI